MDAQHNLQQAAVLYLMMIFYPLICLLYSGYLFCSSDSPAFKYGLLAAATVQKTVRNYPISSNSKYRCPSCSICCLRPARLSPNNRSNVAAVSSVSDGTTFISLLVRSE